MCTYIYVYIYIYIYIYISSTQPTICACLNRVDKLPMGSPWSFRYPYRPYLMQVMIMILVFVGSRCIVQRVIAHGKKCKDSASFTPVSPVHGNRPRVGIHLGPPIGLRRRGTSCSSSIFAPTQFPNRGEFAFHTLHVSSRIPHGCNCQGRRLFIMLIPNT